ncbi:slit homolog 2 protein-like [Mizuhopecten yessoensis]|uniref:Slit-like 3 protein n=1 Tax=Mizuhopecten yessoensis TaxID=6573 RepID=A0A210QFY2_MIZYE|nr:slit homolog 2 protein-like [Mizuhopecten yessoensis]XP_021359092.1 slit homolog 2 protein-like [Mizuhopecten yessoensis]XP_021359093.1 slit homolog 2 protein-like [Mizuhopecten yessoensis]OWF47667.1 Slit-like 3 protein [Mizuhopecten yessoensis]
METFLVVAVLFLAVSVNVILGATKEFAVSWYDGREHVFRYNWTNYGECLFTSNPDILKCMGSYTYKAISDIWRYDPEAISYVSVRCQQQEYFADHRHVCICKNGTGAANPTSSRQHDIFYFCQVTKLFANTFEDMMALETLDLSDNSITSVEGESLKGITSLKYLNMGRNPLVSLPDGLLCDVPTLEVLSLENTRMTSFPAHVFDCGKTFPNLTYIDLSDGVIASIFTDSMKNLQNLKSLNLSCNLLSQFPSRTFATSTNLEYLDLSRNEFISFPIGVCEHAVSLKHFKLNENHFKILNMTNLQECSNVTYLDISSNQLLNIIGTLNKAMAIEYLNLSHNFIQEIGDNHFGNFVKLSVLNLAKNDIVAISQHALKGLPSLNSLNLSGNKLSNSSALSLVFRHLENLTELCLTGNDLQNLPDGMFESMVKLKTLDLSQNSLKSLKSEAFRGLVFLTNLRLSSNRITDLSADVFQNLRLLDKLDLSNNVLIHFDDIVLPGMALTFNISNNKLMNFPNSFRQTKVVTLDLHANSIVTLSSISTASLQSITFLDLSQNKISRIEEGAFEGLNNLEVLNLTRNQLTVNLSLNVFRGSSKLLDLDLSHNNLTSVDFMFSNNTLDMVKTLRLDHNPIDTVSDMTNKAFNKSSPALETLVISFCRIRNISKYAFKGFRKLSTIDMSNNLVQEIEPLETKVGTQFNLRGNPLLCTCVMKWLADPYVIVDGNTLHTHDYNVGTCEVYPKGYNVSLRQVAKDDFLCRTETGCDSNCDCFSWDRNGPVVTLACTEGLENIPSDIPHSAVDLYLDGNKFSTLSATVGGATALQVENLYLNISGIREIAVNVFTNLKLLKVLDLSNNRLSDILPLTFQYQNVLQHLNLSSNFLAALVHNTFKGLNALRSLDLTKNEFQVIDAISTTELSRFQNAFYVLLGKNPYRCTCANSNFRQWLNAYSNRVRDKKEVRCDGNGREMKLMSQEHFKCLGLENTSGSGKSTVIIAVIVSVVILVVLGAAIFYYKRDLLAVLYTKLHIGCLRPNTDSSKQSDAFIVYNTNDSKCNEWVRHMFMQKLGRKRNYKFSFPDRIQLLQSVHVADSESHQPYDCKCAVFIISYSFMNSNWAAESFRKAWQYSKENKKFRVILVIFGDINVGSLLPEMNQMLRAGDYITARSRAVWDRLIYELPDPQGGSGAHHDDDVSESDVILYNAQKYQTLDDTDIIIGT